MSYKDNIRAILECHFAGFKEEIIDSAVDRITDQYKEVRRLNDEQKAVVELSDSWFDTEDGKEFKQLVLRLAEFMYDNDIVSYYGKLNTGEEMKILLRR